MDEDKNKKEIKNVKWQEDNEKILKNWADKAQCYQVMHNRAHKRFWCLNAWFSIPVIIFSTLTGTANFAQGSVDTSWKSHLIFGVGTLNIISAIITTISQFLGVAQNSEGHRLACVHWDKFARKIKIELSKVRSDRLACNEFIDTCQQDYDRLIETSPDIPSDIIRWFRGVIKEGNIDIEVTGCKLCCYECCFFPCGIDMCNKKFRCRGKKKNDCGRNEYLDIELPEIVGALKPTRINTAETNDPNNDNEYEIYGKDDEV